jgi:solute carrier family 25 phosphate transporter 23/24/25/41
MQGRAYASQLHAFSSIWSTEGAAGFYRGWCANALKVVPQNAIRLVAYEGLKAALGVRRAKSDT